MSEFSQVIDTAFPVLSFSVDRDRLYLLCGCEILVYEAAYYELVKSKRIFEKPGLARSLHLTPEYVVCKDFTNLTVFDRENLRRKAGWQLGEDLSSDICALCSAENHIYASLRDGRLARIGRDLKHDPEFRQVSGSAVWDMVLAEETLYAGNVDGWLLELDPATLETIKKIQAHRQNAKSLYANSGTLFSASQDKSLAAWKIPGLEQLALKKGAHAKAFAIAGRYRDFLLTVSFPCGELKFWELPFLRESKRINLTKCLTGEAIIAGNFLYLVSRAENGVLRGDLARLVKA